MHHGRKLSMLSNRVVKITFISLALVHHASAGSSVPSTKHKVKHPVENRSSMDDKTPHAELQTLRNLRLNPSGAAAPLSQAGYAAVADRCCQAEMKMFMERQVIDLGYEVCEEGGLSGLVPYHSCEFGPKSFDELTADILSDSAERCTWVALAGNCQPVPEDCPQYEGIIPADCSCSRSKAAKVDLFNAELKSNNLGAYANSSAPDEMRIINAGTSNKGEPFDILITTIGLYQTRWYTYNGIWNGFVYIGTDRPFRGGTDFNGTVGFDFRIFKAGTEEPLEVEEIHTTLFDLDGQDTKGGMEFASSVGYGGYVTDISPTITASTLGDNRTQFVSSGEPYIPRIGKSPPDTMYGDNIPDPDSPEYLTQEQRDISVMYFYKNVDNFQFTFGVEGTVNKRTQGRFCVFAFDSPLKDRCGP